MNSLNTVINLSPGLVACIYHLKDSRLPSPDKAMLKDYSGLLRKFTASRSQRRHDAILSPSQLDGDFGFFCQNDFIRFLRLEQKRASRSQRPILLMLLEVSKFLEAARKPRILKETGKALSRCLRETDVKGWYEENAVIGIIFTEIASVDQAMREQIFRKIHDGLLNAVGPERVAKVEVSFHVFPEDPEDRTNGRFDVRLYPDPPQRSSSKQFSRFMKRMIDVAVSLILLIVLFPLFVAVALAIKFTSKGSILFKQERVGLHGRRFAFLKFRSMYVDCDEKKHKEYIKGFIRKQKTPIATKKEDEPVVYKLTEDSRVTPVGSFLRKTSLDELPQLINVLKGEMSLVGPRPPISYECELYDVWHRLRLVEVKPGITGLWQVEGRSSTSFDDMVRLDLRYAKEWSLWLDIKLLLKTPWVVLTCKGAY